jgi:hypothetical protein
MTAQNILEVCRLWPLNALVVVSALLAVNLAMAAFIHAGKGE